jgi:hypothetical protein
LTGALVFRATRKMSYRDTEEQIRHYGPARYSCGLTEPVARAFSSSPMRPGARYVPTAGSSVTSGTSRSTAAPARLRRRIAHRRLRRR